MKSKRYNFNSGFLLFTILLVITAISGMGGWLLSWQRDQFQLLNHYNHKMRLFYLLEKRVDDLAKEILYTGAADSLSRSYMVNHVTINLQAHCFINEDDRQIWEIKGTARSNMSQTRIVRVVTRMLGDNAEQLGAAKLDEGSWCMN